MTTVTLRYFTKCLSIWIPETPLVFDSQLLSPHPLKICTKLQVLEISENKSQGS